MADKFLVLVPHEQTHAPRRILEQARELGPDVTEMRAIKHTMEIIAHSWYTFILYCIANGALAKVAREGWPGKTALLNGQNMETNSELLQSPELTDAHWQPKSYGLDRGSAKESSVADRVPQGLQEVRGSPLSGS